MSCDLFALDKGHFITVEDVIKTYGQLPKNYLDFDFIYFHVTTSANNCASIKKYGILDLKQAYLCKESEIRIFLDQHGVLLEPVQNLLKMKRIKARENI